MNGYAPRTSWPLAVAAVLLLAATGCRSTGTGATDGDVRSGPSSSRAAAPGTPIESPTPQDPVLSPSPGEVIELDQHGPEYVFTREGRYAVRLTLDLVYEVDSPEMWEVYRGRYFSTSDFSGGAGVFSVAGPVTEAWLPAHPCRDRTLTPVGATARDLADALAGQSVLVVIRPRAVSLAGGHGVYLEVRIPDHVNSAACQGGGRRGVHLAAAARLVGALNGQCPDVLDPGCGRPAVHPLGLLRDHVHGREPRSPRGNGQVSHLHRPPQLMSCQDLSPVSPTARGTRS